MNYEELSILLNSAQQAHEQGEFSEEEKICTMVLSELPEQQNGVEDWEQIQFLRSRALCRLAFAMRWLNRTAEGLTVAKRSLAVAIEAKSKRDEANANEAIAWCYRILGNELPGLEHFQRAFDISRGIGYKSGMGKALQGMGVIYCDGIGDHSKALESFGEALSIFEEIGDKYYIAITLGSFGQVYSNLQLYDRALEYCTVTLAMNEEIGSKHNIANDMSQLSFVYLYLGMYEKALEYIGKAISAHEEAGNRKGVALELTQIGVIHFYREEFTLALEQFSHAMAIFEDFGKKSNVAMLIGNIGEVYSLPNFEGYDPVKAEEYLLRAIALNEELGDKPHDQYRALAELYQNEQQWEKSNSYFRQYHAAEKESANEAARKKVAQFELQRELANREINLTAERERSSATTAVLHKVLPSSIADRLIKGEKVADYFASVSILFADIVGFTPIASKMPARKVLAFLNYVFGEFDRIIEYHGCEKIKTIGDGYMAVAGAPIECSDHAERIARAACGMMGDIQLPEDIRASLPKDAKFNIRIGINIGPAFGGIVGEKRFVYDIYSDAVNTAARMESHGEPGRIHVSEEFAFHLQNRMDMTDDDLGGIVFEERDEIEIKGKGRMKTYFMENQQ